MIYYSQLQDNTASVARAFDANRSLECFRASECGIVLIEKEEEGMKILRDWQAKHQAKEEKQALRLKNAKLRAAGKSR